MSIVTVRQKLAQSVPSVTGLTMQYARGLPPGETYTATIDGKSVAVTVPSSTPESEIVSRFVHKLSAPADADG